MKRYIVNSQRISPNFVICELDDGMRYEIRGTEAQVDQQLARYSRDGLQVNAQDCVQPTLNYLSPILSKYEVKAPSAPMELSEEDSEPLLMPTINFRTGQIERNGKPIEDTPILRESPYAALLGEANLVTNDHSEMNEEAYVPPSLDFSDRHVTHQPSKPVERSLELSPNFVTNGSEEEEPAYLPPTMNFGEPSSRR